MSPVDLNGVTQTVLTMTFACSLIFGFVAQRSHFCTMGAVSDIFNMQDWTRMHMWATAAAVAILGFSGLSYFDVIAPNKTLYATSRVLWVSMLVGGLMFGFGMVMASGCGNKTLLRIGAGSLKSLVVFVVMGVAAFATLKGITAVLRVNTVDTFQISVSELSSENRMIYGSLLSLGLLVWALRNAQMRRLSTLTPSLVIGALITSVWFVSGNVGYLAEHPDTLQDSFLATNSGRMESLSFVAPIAYLIDWLMFFSDKNKVITLGIAAVFGVILGGGIEAIISRTFRWEGFGSVEDLANHLCGAVLMGVGGVVAMGCTIGQGLTGISTLAPGSFLAVFGILSGAVLALKYQVWRLDRM